jgi:ATP phosphoribosyltransferase
VIANRESWKDPWKKEKVKQVVQLLQGAMRAEKMVGIKMNVPKEKLKEVVQQLPSLNAPTVANLYQSDWFSVETVVEEARVRELIPVLIKKGAQGIIEYPLNKVI